VEKFKKTRTSHRVELDDSDLRELLKDYIPEDARSVRIRVWVPGGGDWSNTDLDIDRQNTLQISWEEFDESNG